MNTKILAAKDAISALSLEELEEIIPFFNVLLRSGRNREKLVAATQWKAGDQVITCNLSKFENNGLRGKVIRVKKTRVLCEFPNTKWSTGVTIPATCLKAAA